MKPSKTIAWASCQSMLALRVLPSVECAYEMIDRLVALTDDDELAVALGYFGLARERLKATAERRGEAWPRRSYLRENSPREELRNERGVQ